MREQIGRKWTRVVKFDPGELGDFRIASQDGERELVVDHLSEELVETLSESYYCVRVYGRSLERVESTWYGHLSLSQYRPLEEMPEELRRYVIGPNALHNGELTETFPETLANKERLLKRNRRTKGGVYY